VEIARLLGYDRSRLHLNRLADFQTKKLSVFAEDVEDPGSLTSIPMELEHTVENGGERNLIIYKIHTILLRC